MTPVKGLWPFMKIPDHGILTVGHLTTIWSELTDAERQICSEWEELTVKVAKRMKTWKRVASLSPLLFRNPVICEKILTSQKLDEGDLARFELINCQMRDTSILLKSYYDPALTIEIYNDSEHPEEPPQLLVESQTRSTEFLRWRLRHTENLESLKVVADNAYGVKEGQQLRTLTESVSGMLKERQKELKCLKHFAYNGHFLVAQPTFCAVIRLFAQQLQSLDFDGGGGNDWSQYGYRGLELECKRELTRAFELGRGVLRRLRLREFALHGELSEALRGAHLEMLSLDAVLYTEDTVGEEGVNEVYPFVQMLESLHQLDTFEFKDDIEDYFFPIVKPLTSLRTFIYSDKYVFLEEARELLRFAPNLQRAVFDSEIDCRDILHIVKEFFGEAFKDDRTLEIEVLDRGFTEGAHNMLPRESRVNWLVGQLNEALPQATITLVGKQRKKIRVTLGSRTVKLFYRFCSCGRDSGYACVCRQMIP